MNPVYLDYNATTPIHPEVLAAMRPWLETHFGNPSSGHPYGRRARLAVLAAREKVAGLLGCSVDEVLFTSGGTEANNMALFGVARALEGQGRHIITSAIEHPAVTEVLGALSRAGWRISRLPVSEAGQVQTLSLPMLLNPETTLLTVMLANNETGALQPVAELAEMAASQGVLVHTDAAQAVGKVPVDVHDLGVDLLSVAGHKLYAPKGIGALYVRMGTPLERVLYGASQERGLRPGTENVPYMVGLGEACAIARRDLDGRADHMRTLRERLHHALVAALGTDNVRLNGPLEERLPNTLSVGFRGVQAEKLLQDLDGEVSASAGAACHTDQGDSSVLGAMCVPPEFAAGTIRFSTGLVLTEEEVDRAAVAIIAAVQTQREKRT